MFWNLIFREFRGVSHFSTAFLPSLHRHGFQPPFTSGGGVYETCTIVMKNRIYIPVPEAIQSAFIPTMGERKRFEVSCDLLFTEEV
jgi:hypothetical protein